MSVLSISLFIVPDAIMIIGHVYKVISAGNEKGEQTFYPRLFRGGMWANIEIV